MLMSNHLELSLVIILILAMLGDIKLNNICKTEVHESSLNLSISFYPQLEKLVFP